MADLTAVLGGPWSPPPEKHLASPEDQLRQSIINTGITPPPEILIDGQLHRFNSGTKGSSSKGGDKPGWYIAYGDGVPAGVFGCWRAGLESNWRADIGRTLSPIEEMQHIRRMSEAKTLRDVELSKKHEAAAETVESIWAECAAASPDHPYLKLKGISSNGSRIMGDGRLAVPLFDEDGALSSLQYIAHDGGKLYHAGGAVKGRYWMLGDVDHTIYIAEGFATAATIKEQTGQCVVVAYSASNLVPVTEIIRRRYGTTKDVVIVADNDVSGTGQRYAEQACAKYGARMVIPPVIGDANDYVQAGHSLLDLLLPPTDDWLIAADEFCAQPAPLSWLVKHWVQTNALIMVHGPSGGGKTFVVLDWCMRIASELQEWCGNKVRDGSVVYLAGEGHHGLKSRIAAWKQHYDVKKLKMWLSKAGCDLNTAEGYQKVADHLRALSEKPCMIVVDTLHRFLSGDENSAQDAKTMLDACSALMQEFGCSVLLVHHTGVSEETQHRARGSSAWRGALDIEVSIIPGDETKPMQIAQRKSKDAEIAESVFVERQSVSINGWFDEDGESVSSAVIIQVDAPFVEKKESKVSKFVTEFKRAWLYSGADLLGGEPYLTRSAMVEYLVSVKDLSTDSAEKYCMPSSERLIKPLFDNQIIASAPSGWRVICPVTFSAFMLEKLSNA